MNFLKGITWTEIFIFAHTCAALACMLRVLYKQKKHRLNLCLADYPIPFPRIWNHCLHPHRRASSRYGPCQTYRRNEPLLPQLCRYPSSRYLSRHCRPSKSRYHGISKVAEKGTGLGATKGNSMSLLSTTDTIIDSMLADIRAATHSCLLAFYIIEPKGRIEEILNEILAAKARGVDCSILADAVGSRSFLESDWVEKLRQAGVEVHTSLPVGILAYIIHAHRSSQPPTKSLLSTAKSVIPAASTSSTRAISNKTPASENGSMS